MNKDGKKYKLKLWANLVALLGITIIIISDKWGDFKILLPKDLLYIFSIILILISSIITFYKYRKKLF